MYTSAYYESPRASRPRRYVGCTSSYYGLLDRASLEHVLCAFPGQAHNVGIVVWEPDAPLPGFPQETYAAAHMAERIRVPALRDSAEDRKRYPTASRLLLLEWAKETEERRAAAVARVLVAIDAAEVIADVERAPNEAGTVRNVED